MFAAGLATGLLAAAVFAFVAGAADIHLLIGGGIEAEVCQGSAVDDQVQAVGQVVEQS